MFGTILLSICTLMHSYVSWRSYSIPFVKQHVPLKIFIPLSLLLWIVLVLGRIYGHRETGTLAYILEILGMNWMAILFLTFLPILLIDIVTLFGFVMPSLSASLRGLALIAGLTLSAIALFQGMRPPVVQEYEVRLSGLPVEFDGTTVVALSDLHLGSLIGAGWLDARITQVEKQKPDMVVMLGDIFEGHGPPKDKLITIFHRLKPPLGVWAVAGNHEFHGRNNTGVRSMEDAGFRVLRNRWAQVQPGLVLAGVDDLTSRHRSGIKADFLSQALKDLPSGVSILLSHTPWEAEKAAGAGVDLMLSGHTHGGQIWPFDYLVRLAYPLLEGRYDVNGMPVIVMRGTGTWGPRMRLWNPGEILKVTLRSKEGS
jgi:predicted MPP superfamily phosphohydrolase